MYFFSFYVGTITSNCYRDNSERVFDKLAYQLDSNTPQKCDQSCSNLGFLFYGVEIHNECFCGNDLPSDDLKISMSECDYDCAGDSSQKCGGAWAIKIGQTTQQG